MLVYHYDQLAAGYVEGLEEAFGRGEVGALDAEVTAWALMGMGELLGMRWILWAGLDEMPAEVQSELERIIGCVLEAKP